MQLEGSTTSEGLLTDAVSAFCQDLAARLQLEVVCKPSAAGSKTAAALRRSLRRPYAAYAIKTDLPDLERLYAVFDHKAVLVLAGLDMGWTREQFLDQIKSGMQQLDPASQQAVERAAQALALAVGQALGQDQQPDLPAGQSGPEVPAQADMKQVIGQVEQGNLLATGYRFTIKGYPPAGITLIAPPAAGTRLPQADSPQVNPSDPPAAPAGSPILDLPVAEVMSKEVLWVEGDQDIQQVLHLMQAKDVGYAVVGHSGQVQGIISRSGILAGISPYLRPVFARWRRPEDDATLRIRVKWCMSRPVRTVSSEATIHQAIASMLQFGVRCLPVVDKAGTVLGVLTAYDILRYLADDLRSIRPPQAPSITL